MQEQAIGVKYETIEFYLETAKRAIGKYGHRSMLSSEDDIAHVAYMIMRADEKFDGRGNIKGFRMDYARYGVRRLMSKFRDNAKKNRILSLDFYVNSNNQTLQDFIPDKRASIEDEIETKNVEEMVLDFDFITEQEKDCIIRNRLNKETLYNIGKELDLTRERIRQIIESGLTKLRRYYQSR